MIISKEKLEKAFTEWDRRYRENPEEFMTEVDHLLYFAELVKEV